MLGLPRETSQQRAKGQPGAGELSQPSQQLFRRASVAGLPRAGRRTSLPPRRINATASRTYLWGPTERGELSEDSC